MSSWPVLIRAGGPLEHLIDGLYIQTHSQEVTMKITDIRIREFIGTMEYPGTFWEERLRMPNDI